MYSRQTEIRASGATERHAGAARPSGAPELRPMFGRETRKRRRIAMTIQAGTPRRPAARAGAMLMISARAAMRTTQSAVKKAIDGEVRQDGCLLTDPLVARSHMAWPLPIAAPPKMPRKTRTCAAPCGLWIRRVVQGDTY